ncbi:hypothetical protein [Streptomyces sp. NBC_00829]|uniref:hypothetical protein n=1 Tax=Streptomyces sp. NBC_00829 TaxID=2903679 RepID=UPI00386628B0|nr:hypothetical protein OG293_06665 [Streptomyces sp. NBC_00829]
MTAEFSESSIPDEAWEEFQRESEGPARLSAPKEPSARARMVAERLRREDEEAARRPSGARRRTRKGRSAVRAEPPAWRAWPDHQRRQARRRRGWGLLWVVVVAVTVLIVMNPDRTLSWMAG